jgi:hypothetical protein
VLGLVIIVMLAAVISNAEALAVLVLLIWGIPLGIVGYRRRPSRRRDNDGMPVGRLDSLFRRK